MQRQLSLWLIAALHKRLHDLDIGCNGENMNLYNTDSKKIVACVKFRDIIRLRSG